VDDERDPAPDQLIGVTVERAASIIGVSVQKLAAWERIGLVEPSVRAKVAARHVRIYGLSELIELRIVDELIKRGRPVRLVRRIVEAHRSSTIPHPLRELRWATDVGMVFVGFEDGSWVGGRHPTQGVIPEVIGAHRDSSHSHVEAPCGRPTVRRSPRAFSERGDRRTAGLQRLRLGGARRSRSRDCTAS